MWLNRKEDIRLWTQQWQGERFADGRPKVSDDLLARMRLVTVEEAWGVMREKGYRHQYAGDWQILHPESVLVGRAVTCTLVPTRPDLHAVVQDWGAQQGSVGLHNSFVIDTLVEDDVVVVDLFGKVKDGTFAGDNLGTAVAQKTRAGMVIDGGVRDVIRMGEIPNLNAFHRGIDASAIADVCLSSVNAPTRIGPATVLPGDIVLGSISGVVFIPAHLAEEVVVRSERIRKMDEWGQLRIREGVYTSGEIDGGWTDAMKAEFDTWLVDNP
jgi:regulator of RNase E activity RraA